MGVKCYADSQPRQSSWNQTPGRTGDVMIFEEKERARTDPKKPGEDEFVFYDTIAGAAYDVYRARLNEWIAEYPDDERAEAVARFRKTGTLGYQAALAELLVHAALKRQGYSVEVHPPCGHPSRRPDFLARDAEGNAVAFVEVTSFGPALELVSRSKRDAAVYNGIDQAKLPAGCRLGIDIIKHGANTPSIRKLRGAIERWAAAQGEGEAGSPPSKTFTMDDWQIDVFLFSQGRHSEAGNCGSGGRHPQDQPGRRNSRSRGH
jgi:hypothetical protein